MTELHGIVSGIRHFRSHLISEFLHLFPYRETKDDSSYPKPEIIDKEGLYVHWESLRIVLTEEGSEKLCHASEIIIIEYTPSHYNQEDTVDVEANFGHPFPFEQGIFLYHDDEAEIDTPDDEIPACTMPHTCQEPNGHNIEGLMAAVASHRDVDVVAEERSKAHVPAAPEVSHGSTGVGMVEVFREMEPNASSYADCHI